MEYSRSRSFVEVKDGSPFKHEFLAGLDITKPTWSSRAFRYFTYTSICLLAAQAAAMNILAFAPKQASVSAVSPLNAHSYTSRTPKYSTRLTWDSRYMSLSHDYDYLWNASHSSAKISTGDHNEMNKDDSALIAMFHQLQCLAILRKTLQSAGRGVDFGEDWRMTDEEWPRCLDYLRQTITCYADATIEREDLSGRGGYESEVQGTMTWRTCRSADALYMLRAGEEH